MLRSAMRDAHPDRGGTTEDFMAALAAYRAARERRDNDPDDLPPAILPTPVRSVTCTETGRRITKCTCRSQHVATQEMVKFYGRPLGTPIGARRRQ